MEFVANEENLDSFLVEGIRLLVLRPCNTTLRVAYTYQLYLQHSAIPKTSPLAWTLLTSDHSF